MTPKKPIISGEPVFDQATQTLRFEFWNGTTKQPVSLKLKNTTPDQAMKFFNESWQQIVEMARKTPPKDGEVQILKYDL